MTTYEEIETKYGNAIKAFKRATVIRGNRAPSEVSSEIDNALSHLVIHFKQNGNIYSDEHLKKAENHLERAALDSLKIIWLEYWAIFTELLSHPVRSRMRFGKDWNGLRDRLKTGLDELYEKSKKTRMDETKNVGTRIQESIKGWGELIEFIESTVFPEDNDLSEQVFVAYMDSLKRSARLKRWTPEVITFSIGLAVSMSFAIFVKLFM
ncbi:MAG: hypothetical protein FWD37_02555 [Methanomassiliicoccaceae archaeon]|nr:hypothetical protein [Methanomassiliicoccaceae archaeon]